MSENLLQKYSVLNDTFIYACSNEGDVKIFGKGICILLKLTKESNSIKEACFKLNLSYSKAMQIIKRSEEYMGIKLLDRKKGGNVREGSKLTNHALELIDLFEEVDKENKQFAEKNSIRFLQKIEQLKQNNI